MEKADNIVNGIDRLAVESDLADEAGIDFIKNQIAAK